MSNEQNMGPNHSIKTSNQSVGNMLKFRYMGMALKHKKCRKDVTKSGLNWDNACYYRCRLVCLSVWCLCI